jgi:hypothetical protein
MTANQTRIESIDLLKGLFGNNGPWTIQGIIFIMIRFV